MLKQIIEDGSDPRWAEAAARARRSLSKAFFETRYGWLFDSVDRKFN